MALTRVTVTLDVECLTRINNALIAHADMLESAHKDASPVRKVRSHLLASVKAEVDKAAGKAAVSPTVPTVPTVPTNHVVSPRGAARLAMAAVAAAPAPTPTPASPARVTTPTTKKFPAPTLVPSADEDPIAWNLAHPEKFPYGSQALAKDADNVGTRTWQMCVFRRTHVATKFGKNSPEYALADKAIQVAREALANGVYLRPTNAYDLTSKAEKDAEYALIVEVARDMVA